MKTALAGDLLFAHHIPPKIEDVKVYFFQKGVPEKEAEDFFHVYEHRNWTSKTGHFIKNWKAIAYRWIVPIWRTNPLFLDHRAS